MRLKRGVLKRRARGQRRVGSSKRDLRIEGRLREDFIAYFSGGKVVFDYAVDVGAFTSFEKAVWGAMREIPYGETRSYQWIAERIGKPRACRAVGNACGKNPLLIVQPCHRVVGTHGKLGGFSAGLDLKKRLLQLEGADVQQMALNKSVVRESIVGGERWP